MSSAVYQNQTSPRGRVLAWLFCAERSNSPILSQAGLMSLNAYPQGLPALIFLPQSAENR